MPSKNLPLVSIGVGRLCTVSRSDLTELGQRASTSRAAAPAQAKEALSRLVSIKIGSKWRELTGKTTDGSHS
jgi:hypothetical protein